MAHEGHILVSNEFDKYGILKDILEAATFAPMGLLAPGSAHARPSAQPPIDTSGNFSAQKTKNSVGGLVKFSKCFSDQFSRQIRQF